MASASSKLSDSEVNKFALNWVKRHHLWDLALCRPLCLVDSSGLEQAAAAAGSSSTGVSGPEQATAAAVVGEARRSPMEMYNPWNLFQQEHKGKGWSPAKMSAMYKKWRSNPKFKMLRA